MPQMQKNHLILDGQRWPLHHKQIGKVKRLLKETLPTVSPEEFKHQHMIEAAACSALKQMGYELTSPLAKDRAEHRASRTDVTLSSVEASNQISVLRTRVTELNTSLRTAEKKVAVVDKKRIEWKDRAERAEGIQASKDVAAASLGAMTSDKYRQQHEYLATNPTTAREVVLFNAVSEMRAAAGLSSFPPIKRDGK